MTGASELAELNRFLEIADRAADAAGAVLAHYFRKPLSIEAKPDSTPVTVADRDAEAAMRAIIEDAAPDHGILGEELPAVNAGADFTWVIDPIDGTKSFISGKPLFGILVALALRGTPILGVIDQPIIHERWRGARGKATTFNDAPARVRSCAALAGAIMYTTSPHLFSGADGAAYERLRRRVRHALYGGDCYAYGLVASGHADIVVESGLKPYDYAALVPVVEGAGGVITDWNGEPLTLSSDGRVIAAGDPAIHAEALDILRSG